MARSHSVYIACLNDRPIAAFTVKHECKAWVESMWGGRLPTNATILRTRDNDRSRQDPVDVTFDVFGQATKTRREHAAD